MSRLTAYVFQIIKNISFVCDFLRGASSKNPIREISHLKESIAPFFCAKKIRWIIFGLIPPSASASTLFPLKFSLASTRIIFVI
jgi:hypothetical protein